MGVGEGDEVIMPAFTCVVVPNAVIYLGAKPVYVDIDKNTYNVNVELIEAKITSKTKVILAQNTFGLPPDLKAIQRLAQKHNLRVIEDCTHGFGGKYDNRKNGTEADASFFSSQWNKPFSTGIGGFSYIKDPDLIAGLRKAESKFDIPSFKDQLGLKAMITARNIFSNSSAYWFAVKTYRWLSKAGMVIGSSEDAELTGTKMPASYLKAMSNVQMNYGLKQISQIDDFVEKRNAIAKQYSEFLSNENFKIPFVPEGFEHTYLKYPLLVSDRKIFFERAQKAKVEVGDWFISPIHPVIKNFHQWNYEPGLFPVADDVSQHIVNLSTNTSTSNAEVERTINFLKANKDLIIR